MNEVTQILSRVRQGDCEAARELLPLVYDELRSLAAKQMTHENPGQTLQATALVHEAYLRLVDKEQTQQWDNRGHFFGAAAKAMRQILVDNARRKKRIKHGGKMNKRELDEMVIAAPVIHEDFIALDAALDRLQNVDPQAVQLVHLRYFVGVSSAEAAKMLDMSSRTADRVWAFARAWLHQEISGSEKESGEK